MEVRLVEAGFLTYTYSGEARFEAHRFPAYVHDAIRALAGEVRSTRIDASPHEVAIHHCIDTASCSCPRYPVVALGSTWNGWACPTFEAETALRFLGAHGRIYVDGGVLRIESPFGDLKFEANEDGNYPLGSVFQFQVCPDRQGIRYGNGGWPLDPQFGETRARRSHTRSRST